jgi:hypothetical protein
MTTINTWDFLTSTFKTFDLKSLVKYIESRKGKVGTCEVINSKTTKYIKPMFDLDIYNPDKKEFDLLESNIARDIKDKVSQKSTTPFDNADEQTNKT